MYRATQARHPNHLLLSFMHTTRSRFNVSRKGRAHLIVSPTAGDYTILVPPAFTECEVTKNKRTDQYFPAFYQNKAALAHLQHP